MNILLFSMPDSFEHMPTVAIRMPNGALTSLAGNLDPHHRVAAADLLLVQNRVRETVDRLVEGMRFEPPVPPKRDTPTRLPFSPLRHLPFPPAFYAGCSRLGVLPRD